VVFMAEERYKRNIGTFTEEGIALLAQKRVMVVGCGGLGGFVIETLGRSGVGHITAVDFDVFEESNLNRQLLSETPLIGTSKAIAARERMKRVNPLIHVEAIEAKLTEENMEDLIAGHDLVVDALDSLPVRRLLQAVCEKLGLPLVHGAIGGWYGQVSVIMPGDRILDKIYGAQAEKGVESALGTPGFTPAVVGSIQACETIKLLIGRGEQALCGKLLCIDLLTHEYITLNLA